MAEPETSRRACRDSDKTNKQRKFTLDEALQELLEFANEINYSDLSD